MLRLLTPCKVRGCANTALSEPEPDVTVADSLAKAEPSQKPLWCDAAYTRVRRRSLLRSRRSAYKVEELQLLDTPTSATALFSIIHSIRMNSASKGTNLNP